MTSWIETGSLPAWEDIVDAVTKFMDADDMDLWVRQLFLDLAARVADPGWTDLAFAGGANFSAGGVPPQYRQVGPFCWIEGSAQRNSLDLVSGAGLNGTNIFTLPTAMWPAQDIWRTTFCQTAGAKVEVKIAAADGGVQVRNTGTVDVPSGTAMGISAHWLAG